MAGFKWAVDIEEFEGSWWREFWARSWKLLTRQEVTDRIQLAEDALSE